MKIDYIKSLWANFYWKVDFMILIVGLGNPESDYSKTRHNMGFNVINKIADKYGILVTKSKFKGLYGTGEIGGEKVILLKPQTFMNLSGESVKEAVNFYKIDLSNVLIIYDDIDLKPGIIRIRKNGGPGTHNGMKSVVHELQSEEFPRIRVGIGKPEHGNLIEYVIGAVSEEDRVKLQDGVNLAADATEMILKDSIDIAMNKFN